jgi:uncharacterized protein (DUF4213/DUF364 family)
VKILDELIGSLPADAPAREVRVGRFWTGVWSRECGLASTPGAGAHEHGARFVQDAGSLTGRSALELARLAYSDSPLEAGIGLAAINSLLEVDEARCVELNAGDLLLERGRGKRVALVGHFPFVPALREAAARLEVLELHPRSGDAPAEEADVIVPQADIVAITGSAFINHSPLARAVRLRRGRDLGHAGGRAGAGAALRERGSHLPPDQRHPPAHDGAAGREAGHVRYIAREPAPSRRYETDNS